MMMGPMTSTGDRPARSHTATANHFTYMHLGGGIENIQVWYGAQKPKSNQVGYNCITHRVILSGSTTTIKGLKTGLKELHTLHVRTTLENYRPNTVLNAHPPKIHKDETHLSRPTRTTLAQLRTGYSKTLQSYMHRLDPTIPDICPDCLLHPHTFSTALLTPLT